MVALGLAEQRAHEAVVQVDNFVDQRGARVEDHRHQRRVTASGLQVAQVLGGHRPAFAGEFQQSVLVDGLFQPVRQPEFTQRLQPLQVGQHLLGLGRPRRLAQPDQLAALGAFPDRQQPVEGASVVVGQWRGQRLVHLARAARQCFAAHPLDDLECRQDDALLSQPLDQRFGQHDAPVGLLGQFGERAGEAAVVRNRKGRQVQPRLQFGQMLAPGLRPPCILRPNSRLDTQLPADDGQQGRGRFRVGRQGEAGIAQVAQLHRKAEPVVMAAPLADRRQVGLGKGVVADQFIVGRGEGQQRSALGGRQQAAAWHRHASVRR